MNPCRILKNKIELHKMAYYDQYNSRNAPATYPPQQYNDSSDTAFNPYDNTQPHQTYEQAGYGYQDAGYGGYRDEPAGGNAAVPPKAEKSVFENDAYATRAPIPRSVTSAILRR